MQWPEAPTHNIFKIKNMPVPTTQLVHPLHRRGCQFSTIQSLVRSEAGEFSLHNVPNHKKQNMKSLKLFPNKQSFEEKHPSADS